MFALALSLACAGLTGCGTLRGTIPERSAMEQLLMSTAADRAVEKLYLPEMIGRPVYVDDTHLDCLDQEYVVGRVRMAVLENGGRLTNSQENARLKVELSSGAMSVDKQDWLLGLPQLPLPIPTVDQTVKLPEMPLFKVTTYRGVAKVIIYGTDPETGAELSEPRIVYGHSMTTYLWLLFIGPIRWSDLPEEAA